MYLETFKRLLADSHGKEVKLGLALLHMKRDRAFPGGHETLWQFVKHELTEPEVSQTGQQAPRYPHYSTLTRWIRAAETLEGDDDPRADLGISRILQLRQGGEVLVAEEASDKSTPRSAGRSTATKARKVAWHCAQEFVGDVIRHALDSHNMKDVHCRVTGAKDPIRRRVKATAVVEGPPEQFGRGLSRIAEVMGELELAQAAWVKRREPATMPVPWAAPIEVMDELGPGQLTAKWDECSTIVTVLKQGEPILSLPVERVPRVRGRIVTAGGNTKTHGRFAIIDSISHGCLRRATGLSGCHKPCFTVENDPSTGCYVNHLRWAARLAKHEDDVDSKYNVIHNGLVNNHLRIRLPHDGKADLSSHPEQLWRVDSETGEGSLSIALGLFQSWAQYNPKKYFCTICSHSFRPSDAMLAWTGSLHNVWVGHSVSAGLSEQDLQVRLESLRRYRKFGIFSFVWLVTHEGWDNERLLQRLKHEEKLGTDTFIECPLRHGRDRQELPTLGLPACGSHRLDRRGIPHTFEWERNHEGDGLMLTMDGRQLPKRLPALYSKCEDCSIRCGYSRFISHRSPWSAVGSAYSR